MLLEEIPWRLTSREGGFVEESHSINFNDRLLRKDTDWFGSREEEEEEEKQRRLSQFPPSNDGT